MKRGDVIGVAVVVCVAIGAYFLYNRAGRKLDAPAMTAAMASGELHIAQRWSLPDELLEVSGIAWAGDGRIACVEDNAGVIHFFDLASNRVTDRLSFAGPGDFEGLALAGDTYYALRSDGTLFEVKPGNAKPLQQVHRSPFSTKNDCESLSYDATHNRLLVGVKELDLTDPQRKGVYAFDLATKRFSSEAVYYISGSESAGKGKKKSKGSLRPSDLETAPGGGGLYVLDGPRCQLLLTNAEGSVERSIQLDKSVFPQPEGICFAPNGDLYISSEGTKKGAATLARVQLN